MSKHDYTALDDVIVKAIETGSAPVTFFMLLGAARRALPGRISDEARFLDRRLQALRRANRIVYAGQKAGWKVVKPAEAA